MSATNQTTNYELPLFIGTDKPSWLGDFNGAMNAIDTAIKGRADDISSLQTRMTATETVANTASSTASTALTNANNAQTTANTAVSNAETADTKATSAQTTANTALSNASTAQNTANNANSTAQSALTSANLANTKIDDFNLTIFETITSFTASHGSATGTIKVAKNTDGSLAKIYGNVIVTSPSVSSTTQNQISFSTSLRPSTPITITNALIARNVSSQYQHSVYSSSLTIATDGTCTASLVCYSDTTEQLYAFIPCLYWIKDFGDVSNN